MKNISKENYLSTIYRHRNNEGGIKAKQLAEQLEISKLDYANTLDFSDQNGEDWRKLMTDIQTEPPRKKKKRKK